MRTDPRHCRRRPPGRQGARTSRDKTAGEVISELARAALNAPAQPPRAAQPGRSMVFAPFPSAGASSPTRSSIACARTTRTDACALDVNVLIALLDADHALHGAADALVRGPCRRGLGVLSDHPERMRSRHVRLQAIRTRCRSAPWSSGSWKRRPSKLHEFWPDAVSLLDARGRSMLPRDSRSPPGDGSLPARAGCIPSWPACHVRPIHPDRAPYPGRKHATSWSSEAPACPAREEPRPGFG